MDKPHNTQSQESRLYLLLGDEDGRAMSPAVLVSRTDADHKGIVVSQLTDDKGNPLSEQWASRWQDFKNSLQARLNATYGRGVLYKAYPNALRSGAAVLDNRLARLIARDGEGNRFIGGIDMENGLSVLLNPQTLEMLSRRSFGEEFRKDEERERTEKETASKSVRKEAGISPEEIRSLTLEAKEKGKMSMTVIAGGRTFNHEVTGEEMKTLTTTDTGKKADMFARMFRQIDIDGMDGKMKERIGNAVTAAVRNPGVPQSMPRPEVYASTMKEDVQNAAMSLQALAGSEYADRQQTETAGRSMGIGR